MPGIIHLLPDSVANQIAAGEVIQRPASVVKELTENAVDAGSTRITVIIKDAGKTLVQVTDNGSGMSATDARLCFERHATSKIRKAEDLMAVRTLGFRGEALSSIASVAQVTLKTRPVDEELGTELVISGSGVESQEMSAGPAGSSFCVKNLFYNVPARRKFLKSNNVEFRNIVYEFQRIALARPEIEFILIHNDNEVYNLPAGNMKQRIVGIFGKAISQNLTPISVDTNIISVKGFLGKPENARKSAGEQFFFINRRFMRHPYLHKALMSAYEKILPPDSIPSYFICFEASPDSIDVNIHPTKTEIKFENELAIYHILNAAVRESLGKFNILPSIDFDRESSIDIPVFRNDGVLKTPPITVNPGYNPFDQQYPPPHHAPSRDMNLANWEKLYSDNGNADIAPFGMQAEPENPRLQMNFISPEDAYLQMKGRYVLTPVKSGVMIIDQKRAHERILYETYIASLAHQAPVAQRTLFPEKIEFDTANYLVLQEIAPDLRTIGFDITDSGDNSMIINGGPVSRNKYTEKEIIEKFLEYYKNTDDNITTGNREKIACALAVANAAGYGEKLTGAAMRELVDNLFACENPNYSPEGKPVLSIIPIEEIEKRF